MAIAKPFVSLYMNQSATQTLPEKPHDVEPAGVGGWLLILVIKMWVGMVVRGLGGIADSDTLVVLLLNLSLAALAGVGAYLLGRKNAKGVLIAKIYLALEAVYYLAALVAPAQGSNQFKMTGFFVASILYLLYMFRSKRVKNTYFPQRLSE